MTAALTVVACWAAASAGLGVAWSVVARRLRRAAGAAHAAPGAPAAPEAARCPRHAEIAALHAAYALPAHTPDHERTS